MTHKCPNNKSIIYHGKIYTGCELDVGNSIPTGEYSAKFNREWQKAHYRAALAQPNMPRSFVKAVGVERARQNGYSDEMIRKYG